MISRLTASFLLLILTPMAATSPSVAETRTLGSDLVGSWVFHAGDKGIFLFSVIRAGAQWSGVWTRPEHFSGDGETFFRATGPVVRWKSKSSRVMRDTIELTFIDPNQVKPPATFAFRVVRSGLVEARPLDTPGEPLPLERQLRGERFGNWVPDHAYARIIDRPTNKEMTAIFAADQLIREHWSDADHIAAAAADVQRRSRAQALIESGELQSADDYFHAAYVFQHGTQPEDILKAHILAIISIARGRVDATWIAAATQDRFLQMVDHSQVFGTQYQSMGGKITSEPYDQTILPDALRQAMRVPVIAEQKKELIVRQARLQEGNGDFVGAVENYNQALGISPDDTGLLTERALVYLKIGDRAGAEMDFVRARALARSPNDLNELCWAKATAGLALEAALADCNAALDQESENVEFHDSRGLVLLRMGRYSEAIADYNRALAGNPARAGSRFGRAIARLKQGDKRGFDVDFAEAIRVDSSVVRRFENYGIKP